MIKPTKNIADIKQMVKACSYKHDGGAREPGQKQDFKLFGRVVGNLSRAVHGEAGRRRLSRKDRLFLLRRALRKRQDKEDTISFFPVGSSQTGFL